MRRADRRDRRLRRARELHRPAGPHVLVGDVHAARVLRRGARRRGRAPAGRGLRRRRRGVPAQVHREDPRPQEPRRDASASCRTPRPQSSGCASGRSSARKGEVEYDGAAARGDLPSTSACSRPRRIPPSVGRGLARVGNRRGARRDGRGWRTATARRGASSSRASRSWSGSASSSPSAVPPPRIVARVAGRDGSLLGVERGRGGELGWDGSPGTIELRFPARAAAARRRALPALRRPRRTRTGPGSTTGSTRRSSSRLRRHRPRGWCCFDGDVVARGRRGPQRWSRG